MYFTRASAAFWTSFAVARLFVASLIRFMSAEVSALFLFEFAESTASLAADRSLRAWWSCESASLTWASAFAFSMRATFQFCCVWTTFAFWSSGIAAMYISSKCLSSGPGGLSDEPHATKAITPTAQTKLRNPRISGPSLLRSGRRGLPSHRTMTTLLAVDVGNTNTVLGVFRDDELAAHWRIQTVAQRTSDEYAVLLKTLLDLDGFPWKSITAGIISSVVPPTLFGIQQFFKRHCGGPALGVGPGIKSGMPILYENPREVGADRIVNAVAAFEEYKSGCIVVDFGTATAWDVVNPKGEYMGGVIAPAAQKALGAGPGRMMASRGRVPLPPADQLAVLYQLAIDADQNLATAARTTAMGLPDTLLAGALATPANDPRVLELFAQLVGDNPAAFEALVATPNISDATIAFLAANGGAREIARIATVDRVVERAGRNDVRVPGRAAWDEIARALQAHPTPPESYADDQGVL